MPKTTFPIHVGDPILRTCRRCRSRVAAPSMCLTHPRTCMTCCTSLNRRCGLEPWDIPTEKYFPDMTYEERQADMAQLRAQLGFRPLTDAEIAEEERWRTA